MPKFYIIIARKIFCPEFWGARAPAPRLLRLWAKLEVKELTMVVGCVQTVKDTTDWMSEQGRRVVSYMEPSSWALASTAQTMTVWMTLLVTADRYVAVCQPWRVADLVSHRRRARLAVGFILLAAIVYNVPRYFERQVHSYSPATLRRHALSAYTVCGEKKTPLQNLQYLRNCAMFLNENFRIY